MPAPTASISRWRESPQPREAWHLILPVEQELDRIFSLAIWGKDDDTLEGSIGQMLDDRGQTLGSMESCTGGLFASTVTDVPGASQFFRGGIVSYWTDMKMEQGVDPEVIEEFGAISPETALAMARAAATALRPTTALGSPASPAQTHRRARPRHSARRRRRPRQRGHDLDVDEPGRQAVKRRAVTTALLLTRRALMGDLPRG
jgi:nicotinamide-nucleotide amidase